MKKVIKLAVWAVVGFVVLAVLLAASLPLWINPVATAVAGRVVPGFTGTDFRIGRFSLNPYSGSLRIGGVKLSNPEGFGEAAAVSFSAFSVDLDVGSVFSDTVFVKEVVLEDLFVSYYSHDGKNNFDVIKANVERATGPKDGTAGASGAAGGKEPSKGKKVVIGRLLISDAKVKFAKSDLLPPFALPSLELKDIGRKSGGATAEEAWRQISDGVMKSFAAAGDTAFNAVDLFGNTAKGTVDTVGDTTKKAAEGVKNLFRGFGK